MRLSWLSRSQFGPSRAPRRRRKAAPSLRVRQLERRRVLDAAMQSLLITPTVPAAEPTGSEAQNETLIFEWAAAQQSNEAALSRSEALVEPVQPAAFGADLPAADGPITSAGDVQANVRPVLIVAVDQTASEGSTLDLSGVGGAPPLGLFIDADTSDTHIAKVDWGDGSPTEAPEIFAANGSGALGGKHTYANEGVYTVTVSVIDQAGGSDMQSFEVTVNNVRPVLVVAIDQTVNEGQPLDLSGIGGAPPLGLFIDNGKLDTHTATVNWGDGSATEDASIFSASGSGALGGIHTYVDNGVYTVTVSVIDNFGDSDTETFTVAVGNVAPTAALNNDGPVNEGATASVFFSDEKDPSAVDTAASFRYAYDFNNDGTFDVGDGTYAGSSLSASQVVPASLLEDGPASPIVRARIIDKDGGYTDYLTEIEVNNVRPSLTNIAGHNIDEGDVAIVVARVVDPSPRDVFEVDVDWRDSTTNTISGLGAADANGTIGGTDYQWTAAARELRLSHRYLDDDPTATLSDTYGVMLTVRDDDGGQSDPYTAPVTVNNVRPVLVVATDQSLNEGHELDLSAVGGAPPLGLFIDNGQLDTHTATVDWGDGSAIEDATIFSASGSGALGGKHTYADDGVYTVTVTITDDDGGSDTQSFLVTVRNVAPTLTEIGLSATTIGEGRAISLDALFSDPGFDNELNPNPAMLPDITDPLHESFTYDIDWGDGRQAIVGAAVADSNGSPGNLSSGAFSGSHTYADDGVYTITITVHDDNGGSRTEHFSITVENRAPSLTEVNELEVNEGSAFSLIDFDVRLSDPGFDNPLNPLEGGELQELFAIHSINWGDGGDTDFSSPSIVNRISGSPGVPTTAQLAAGAYTYADDGDYTVTVRVADDDMGAFSEPEKFTTGVAGVDFIDLTFTIHVNNVAPTLRNIVPSVTTINESEGISFTAQFTDPGFDNERNPNPPTEAIADPLHESFTYDIDWDDGRQQLASVAVADENGAAGRPSSGMFGGSHIYADDGTYTVRLTIHDDNGGQHTQMFLVTVQNVNPSFVPAPNGASFAGDDISSEGITTIRVSFSDPGFDNAANPNLAAPPSITDTLHESFTHLLDWGDGTIDAVHTYVDSGVYNVTVTMLGPGGMETFAFDGLGSSLSSVLTLVSGQALNDPAVPAQLHTYLINWGDGAVQTVALMLKEPGDPLPGNGLTTVISSERTSGDETMLTDGSFIVEHRYLGPPDPENPVADIPITVTVMDDNNGSVSDFILVSNPGIQTPDVPIAPVPALPNIQIVAPPQTQVFIDEQASTTIGLQTTEVRLPSSELPITTDLYVELEVVGPDGEVISTHRIRDEALFDLRAFFRTLPDGHYRIFLVRTENNSRRLIIEVFVRRGRVIDPADDSEGTRDRPPTSEAVAPQKEPQAVPNETENAPAQNAVGPQAQENTLPGDQPAATGTEIEPVELDLDSPQPPAPSSTALRWMTPLAGLALAATRSRRTWADQVDEAFQQGGTREWQRLRRAGRLRCPIKH